MSHIFVCNGRREVNIIIKPLHFNISVINHGRLLILNFSSLLYLCLLFLGFQPKITLSQLSSLFVCLCYVLSYHKINFYKSK